MICPCCSKDLELHTPAIFTIFTSIFTSVEIYQKEQIAKTKCCDKLITIKPKMTFVLDTYKGKQTEDNWGN